MRSTREQSMFRERLWKPPLPASRLSLWKPFAERTATVGGRSHRRLKSVTSQSLRQSGRIPFGARRCHGCRRARAPAELEKSTRPSSSAGASPSRPLHLKVNVSSPKYDSVLCIWRFRIRPAWPLWRCAARSKSKSKIKSTNKKESALHAGKALSNA